MILLSGNANPKLAENLSKQLKTPLAKMLCSQFSDGESRIEISDPIHGQDVFIVQSTCNPNNHHWMELLLLCDAAHRAAAKRITAVIPYFGYARQDKRLNSQQVPIGGKMVADLLATVGVDRVLSLDLHSDSLQGFFSMPVDNLSAAKVFLQDIQDKKVANSLIVSPDVGGVVRARSFAKQLHAELAIIDKRRPKADQAEVMHVIGTVKDRDCIVVDDIIDTGNTLCLAAKALKEQGAKRVLAYVTHPVLSNNAVQLIQASELDEVVVTNSIPLSKEAENSKRIHALSIAPLFADAILKIHQDI